MTALEMRRAFVLLMNANSVEEMQYNSKEVGEFLTSGMNEIVYNALNSIPSVDSNSLQDAHFFMLKADLSVDSGSMTPHILYPNAVEFSLDTATSGKYLVSHTDRVDITYSELTGDVQYLDVPVKPVKEDEYNELIKSPLHRPDRTVVWRISTTGIDKTFILVGDSKTVVDKYKARYIKYPTPIVIDLITPANCVDCELHKSVHDEIVRCAVRLAQGAVGSQKYQIGINEFNNIK